MDKELFLQDWEEDKAIRIDEKRYVVRLSGPLNYAYKRVDLGFTSPVTSPWLEIGAYGLRLL